ncbi:chaplin [Streptomyces sp. BH097]|uniref:chaplin n=1 Tax=unclassified Streptomyces TaxID=2593676 RepID=UPI003BB6BB12
MEDAYDARAEQGEHLVRSGPAMADTSAHDAAAHSPDVLSGNLVQVPIHIPVHVCGNTVNVIGALPGDGAL